MVISAFLIHLSLSSQTQRGVRNVILKYFFLKLKLIMSNSESAFSQPVETVSHSVTLEALPALD